MSTVTDIWRPTEADVQQWESAQGWPTFEAMRLDHISDKGERGKLTAAIEAVKRYVQERPSRPGLSLMLIATGAKGDMERTGYGCGKTTLATIAYHSTRTILYCPGDPGSIQASPGARLYEARELMAQFDKDDYDIRDIVRSSWQMVVIDDVGREGALKWEKRDAESQAAERQSRYYNVVNQCYQKNISIVLTSNLPSRTLAEHIGGASWSRLLEMCPPEYRLNLSGVRDYRPLLTR